uniref:Uncharacterized protein n=1 Tax=Aegilops tauschii subsp. strangulata TaxID=200361 RepID=A0A453KS51_AEGTS
MIKRRKRRSMVGDTSNDLGIILTSYSKPASTASSIYVSLQQQGDRKEGQHEWNVSPSRGLALTSLHGDRVAYMNRKIVEGEEDNMSEQTLCGY